MRRSIETIEMTVARMGTRRKRRHASMNSVVETKKPTYFIRKKYTRISATDTMNCTGLKPAKTVSTPLSTPKRRAFNIIWTR